MTNQSISMASRSLRVFLCHSSGDKPTVRKLYQRLQACNIDPWLDEENLLPGQNWEQEIRIAVRDTDVVIVCLSNGSINKKGFVQKEIKFALDVADEQPEGTIFLIPLRLEESEVPERLRSWHWVNYFKKSGFDRLLMALKRRQESLSDKGIPIAIIDTLQVEEEELVRKAEFEEKQRHQLQEEEQTLEVEEKRLNNLEEERRRRNEEAEQERIRQAEQIKSPLEVRGTIVPTSSPTPILSNQNSEQSTINVTASPTVSLKLMNTDPSKLIKSSIWQTPFIILLGLLFILPIVISIIAYNIPQPYGPINPLPGLDHAVEFGLSVILLLVAIIAIWFTHTGFAFVILLLTLLSTFVAGFAFLLQTLSDIQQLPSVLTQVNANLLLTVGLSAASLISLLWLTRPYTLLDRILILAIFGVAGVCTLLQLSLLDSDVSKHIYLLISLILLIQGVLIAAQTERVRVRRV